MRRGGCGGDYVGMEEKDNKCEKRYGGEEGEGVRELR